MLRSRSSVATVCVLAVFLTIAFGSGYFPSSTQAAVPALVVPLGTNTPSLIQSTAELAVTPSSVAAGSATTITVTGAGFSPGEQVTVDFSVPLAGLAPATQQAIGSVTANGTFSTQLSTPPSQTIPGTYLIFALGTTSRRFATAHLTVLNLPTATPTATAILPPAPPTIATVAPTATPPQLTIVPAPTRTPGTQYVLSFRRAYLWYTTVRAGTFDRVVIRANHHQRLTVALHVIFPGGHAVHIAGRTNREGRWAKSFAVPRGAYHRHSPTAVVVVQLRHQLATKEIVLPFSIIRPR